MLAFLSALGWPAATVICVAVACATLIALKLI
jgi:hypothetical protein